MSPEDHPLYFDGTIYTIGGNRRLALLGDRVLSLALCEIWFHTENSNREHSLMSQETVSRAALAITGGAIGLKKIILAKNNTSLDRWNFRIAETFEAVLGAVYVDSNYNVKAIKAIINKLKLDDHRFLRTQAEMDIPKITPELSQSVDQHAVMPAPLTQSPVNGAQNKAKTEEQGSDELSRAKRPNLVLLERLTKSRDPPTAESARRTLVKCENLAKEGTPFDPNTIFATLRKTARRLNRSKARAERAARGDRNLLSTTLEKVSKETRERTVVHGGDQQSAQKITVIDEKAHQMAHERDGPNGEDSTKTRGSPSKQEKDNPKNSTETRKAEVQQFRMPAIEKLQEAEQALQKAHKETHRDKKLHKTAKSDKKTRVTAEKQARVMDVLEEKALGSIVGKKNEISSAHVFKSQFIEDPSSRSITVEEDVKKLERAILESHMEVWQLPPPKAHPVSDPNPRRCTRTTIQTVDFVRHTAKEREAGKAKEDSSESGTNLLLGSLMQDDGLEVEATTINGELGKYHATSSVHEVSRSKK